MHDIGSDEHDFYIAYYDFDNDQVVLNCNGCGVREVREFEDGEREEALSMHGLAAETIVAADDTE